MNTQTLNLKAMDDLSILKHLKGPCSQASQTLMINELIERAQKRTAARTEIEEQLKRIESDERLGYPVATVFENAGLALVQCALEHQRMALKRILNTLDEGGVK